MATQYVPVSTLVVTFDITLPEYAGFLVVLVDTSAVNREVTLPEPGAFGRIKIIKATDDANTVTVTPASGYDVNDQETLDTLDNIGDSVDIGNDGSDCYAFNPSVTVP